MRKFLSLLMAFVLLSCTANASAAAAGGYETLRDLISSTIEDEGDANTATGYNMGCSALIVSIPKGELILFGEGKKGEIVCTEWKIDNDTQLAYFLLYFCQQFDTFAALFDDEMPFAVGYDTGSEKGTLLVSTQQHADELLDALGIDVRLDDELLYKATSKGSSNTSSSKTSGSSKTSNSSTLISVDDYSVFYFSDLPWDSDLDTVASAIKDKTGMKVYMNSDNIYDGLVCYPEKRMRRFPGLTSDCYLAAVNVYPEPDDTWWLECQIAPSDVKFKSPSEAADWFSSVWRKLAEKLDLPYPSDIKVVYPKSFKGTKTVRATDSPSEYLDAWAKAIEGGTQGISIRIVYNNMTLALENAVLGDGTSFNSCWIILEPRP